MKKLILIFCLLPFIGLGQIRLSSYQKKMDSLAVARMDLRLKDSHGKTYIATFRPYQWVKVTFKTTVNKSIINKIKFDELLDGGIDDAFSDIGSDDLMSLAAYDMRTKFYFKHRNSFNTRIFATGLKGKSYFYSIGFTLKF